MTHFQHSTLAVTRNHQQQQTPSATHAHTQTQARTCYIAPGGAWCCLELSVFQVGLASRGHQAVCKGNQGVLGAVPCVGLVLVTALML